MRKINPTLRLLVVEQKKTFLAKIRERHRLNPGSDKETYHLVIDLRGSDIEYAVGDCLGIYPENDPLIVHQLIKDLQVSPQLPVLNRYGNLYPLKEFLKRANLSRLPATLPQGNEGVTQICKKLPPLLPRFYSIASSQNVVGQEAHLTVGVVDGVCSHFLCYRAPIDEAIIPIFLHRSPHFSLPPESFDKPLIMIGPGTGVAPFRGFIQERLLQKVISRNWLFFGERKREHDFYYQKEWEHMVDQGVLKLDCAFSRDQEQKIYVQHRMEAQSLLIWEWLQEGAYFFVCGDAAQMAKEVDKMLHVIAELEGRLSPTDAKTYIKELKHKNRYQRDVY